MMLRRFVLWLLTRAFGPWSPSMSVLGAAPTLAWVWSGRHAHLADLRTLPRPWEKVLDEEPLLYVWWTLPAVASVGVVDAYYVVLAQALVFAAMTDRAEEVCGGR